MGTDKTIETHKLCYPKDLCDPKDWLNFVQLDPFPKTWSKLGMDDEDLRALEVSIMVDPLRPPVVAGTGGLRKIRFGREGSGKQGGARVCYVFFKEFGLIALIIAYGKSQKDDLTKQESSAIKTLVAEIEGYLKGRR